MTDPSWDEGMALLEANLRDRDLTPGMKGLRGQTLRTALDHLTDDQWGWLVHQAIRKPDGWFPTLGELEEMLRALPPRLAGTDRPLLPGDTRTVEEKREAGRQAAAAGLKVFYAELKRLGVELPTFATVGKAMPGAQRKRAR